MEIFFGHFTKVIKFLTLPGQTVLTLFPSRESGWEADWNLKVTSSVPVSCVSADHRSEWCKWTLLDMTLLPGFLFWREPSAFSGFYSESWKKFSFHTDPSCSCRPCVSCWTWRPCCCWWRHRPVTAGPLVRPPSPLSGRAESHVTRGAPSRAHQRSSATKHKARFISTIFLGFFGNKPNQTLKWHCFPPQWLCVVCCPPVHCSYQF